MFIDNCRYSAQGGQITENDIAIYWFLIIIGWAETHIIQI